MSLSQHNTAAAADFSHPLLLLLPLLLVVVLVVVRWQIHVWERATCTPLPRFRGEWKKKWATTRKKEMRDDANKKDVQARVKRGMAEKVVGLDLWRLPKRIGVKTVFKIRDNNFNNWRTVRKQWSIYFQKLKKESEGGGSCPSESIRDQGREGAGVQNKEWEREQKKKIHISGLATRHHQLRKLFNARTHTHALSACAIPSSTFYLHAQLALKEGTKKLSQGGTTVSRVWHGHHCQ